ncbi:hypothetical protein TNCV_160611 [Trichonephila clavipes]|nr:hypothetical protein TNCV_160611 [Trichonephila clavipes]
MLQDYDTSSSRVFFSPPRLSSPPSPLPFRAFLLRPCQILFFISSLVRPVASGSGFELVTKPATIRYLNHSATTATCLRSNLLQLEWCGNAAEIFKVHVRSKDLPTRFLSTPGEKSVLLTVHSDNFHKEIPIPWLTSSTDLTRRLVPSHLRLQLENALNPVFLLPQIFVNSGGGLFRGYVKKMSQERS